MNTRRPANRARGDIARAIGNLIWTTIIVVGSPLALTRFFGYPLPRQVPVWAEVITTPMQLVEPSVVINALVCLGWLVWGVVVAYVLVDIVDLARGVGNRARRLGPASVIAGKLVASIALLISLLRAQPSAVTTTDRPVVAVQVFDTPAYSATAPLKVTLASSTRLTLPEAAPAAPATQATRTYVVQRGDSLWRIAEQQLGDGFRWREIYDLNHEAIVNPDLICTGWKLELPADALASEASPGADIPPSVAETPVENGASEGAATSDPAETKPPTTPAAPAPEVTPPVAVSDPVGPTPATTDAPSPVAEPRDTPAAPDAVVPDAPVPAVADSMPVEPEGKAPAEGPAITTGTTLPLALRAQGFDTQEQYDAWLQQQHDSRPAPLPADEVSPLGRAGVVVGVAVIPALLAAAVVGAVDRRRRRVLQNRPVHADLPRRDPRLRPTEARFRSQPLSGPAEQIAWIDVVLRHLASSFVADPVDSKLLLVRPGPRGIELLWDQPPTIECPDGFAVGSDPQTWDYPCGDADELARLQGRFAGVPHHVNALVTLGDTADGPVLVNLQAVDEIDLVGDLRSAHRWITAVVLELAAHRWAETVDTAIVPVAATPTRLNTSLHIDDAGAARALVWRTDRIEPPARWRLTFDHGLLELSNDGLGVAIALDAVGVDDETFGDTAALLDEAATDPYRDGDIAPLENALAEPVPADGQLELLDATSPGAPDSLSRLRASSDFTDESEHDAGRQSTTLLMDALAVEPCADFAEGATLVVRVLGRVRTVGWTIPPKSPRTEDIVVYLAMARPSSVSRERLIDSLWNGKDVSTKSLYNYIGTLRKEVGDSGVVTVSDGSYLIADTVRTDWEHFIALVSAARDQSWLQRRASLAAALMLVEGRPFDGLDRHQWAALDGTISRVEVAVTDAASMLASEAMEHGDGGMAIWAARRGLAACPWHVRMYGYIIEAHALEGDVIAIEHTWRELQRSLGEDDVPADLVELYVQRRT